MVDRVTEASETRLTEAGETRILEEGTILPTLNLIIKYEQIGASDTRERPSYNYEFPMQLYMVVSD